MGGENSTPYQGDECVFGEFKCPKCKRMWKSAYSWANTYQQCKKCGTVVYPYKQTPLSGGNGIDGLDLSKPHPEELCGKCKALGRPCRQQDKSNQSTTNVAAPLIIGAAGVALAAAFAWASAETRNRPRN